MRKIIILLLVLCLILAGCAGSSVNDQQTPTTPEVDMNTTPVMRLRINEKDWVTADLTPYLGQDYTWISFPIDISSLTEGYNQFALHSNTYNHDNLSNKSLDVFFTATDVGFDSYISQDMMSSWELYPDRYLNLILELYDGENWHVFPKGEDYRLDENTVVGIFVENSGIYNVCRTIRLDSLNGYKKARVSVLAHVGNNLLEEPEPEPIDEGDGYSELDTQVPVLKVKLNGAPFARLDLTSYMGQNTVWVEVPLDVSKLRNGTNWIAIDSNVNNTGNFNDQSVDIYFSPSGSSADTMISTNGRMSWMKIEDHRYANIYLMVHNSQTDQWETFPKDTQYQSSYEHTVIGQFTANDWLEQYHFRRGIYVEDMAVYDDVKACIQLHVGDNLALIGDVNEIG